MSNKLEFFIIFIAIAFIICVICIIYTDDFSQDKKVKRLKSILKLHTKCLITIVVSELALTQFTACDGCGPCNESYIDYARLGHVSIYKNATKYKVKYQSELDLVVSEAEVDSVFNLGLIKNIVDAAIDKNFYRLYVQKSCFNSLKSAYSKIGIDTKTSHYVYEQPIMDCPIFGNYKIAAKVVDKDLYDSTMLDVTKYSIAKDWEHHGDETAFVPFITRGENGR